MLSTGIGAAIATNLASKGCSLLLNYTSDSSIQPCEALCKTLSTQHSIRCIPVQADLSDPVPAVKHIVDTARNHFSHPKTGAFSIDILINNAGVAGNKRLNDPERGPIGPEEFHFQFTVNTLAPLLLTQACVPYLPNDRSGRIVNLSSVSASLSFESQSVYGGTKSALESMTRTWARELAERATVNAVNPGPVWGDMYSEAGAKFWGELQPYQDATPLSAYDAERNNYGEADEKFQKTIKEGMGGRRPAFASEVAGVVAMLCSEDGGWCTGSVVCANGGAKFSV